MIDSFYLAWRYCVFNKVRTAILITSITLIAFLPLALKSLLAESEKQLTARADSTPLLIGAQGSALDLVMSTLYFAGDPPPVITLQAQSTVWDSGLALPIPVYQRFQARGRSIVGTTLDYFEFRGLTIASGRFMTTLGECVLGAEAAHHLNLKVGDSLISSPENPFDIGGVYPLKMQVTGILAPSGSEDDKAIFVDLKTTWVIEGLGHGHVSEQQADAKQILDQRSGSITFNASLQHYTEITADNLDSFHFHGDPSEYPLTALIAIPNDAKSSAILQGRYLGAGAPYQIVKPSDTIQSLLDNIFRIKRILDAMLLLVSLATLLSIVLVFALSLRLREREIKTVYMLGCSRLTVARLLGAEIMIILGLSALICTALLLWVNRAASGLIQGLMMQQL